MKTVIKRVSARVPNLFGEFNLSLYQAEDDYKEHLALTLGEVAGAEDLLVRVHSECFTGDVLGSQRCDCGEQLVRAMQLIGQAGRGAIIYLRQEGRGIGLLDKLRAYNLQDAGHDTIDANLLLGHEIDTRDYSIAAQILCDLQIKSVQVMTNNPDKINQLEAAGTTVKGRVPLEPLEVNDNNFEYLNTKRVRMHHLFSTDYTSPSHRNGHETPTTGSD